MREHPSQVLLQRSDYSALLTRARRLAESGGRRVLGIVGAPGAGKSSLAAQIVASLGADTAALVGMDGFHFAQIELDRQQTAPVKGAIHTFDVGGLLALLRRLRDQSEPVVYAPMFRRDLEEPIGSAVPVLDSVPLVVVEGNYLLADDPGWSEVRRLLDESWYLEPDEDDRMERLINRHVSFGRTPDEASARARGSDQHNAELIHMSKRYATVVVTGSAETPLRP